MIPQLSMSDYSKPGIRLTPSHVNISASRNSNADFPRYPPTAQPLCYLACFNDQLLMSLLGFEIQILFTFL